MTDDPTAPSRTAPSPVASSPAPPRLRVERVRSRFPALAAGNDPSGNDPSADASTGEPWDPAAWVTMDNAGGSQMLGAAADAIHRYLTTVNVQLGATYAPSREASRRVEAGRSAAARLLGAGHPDEVILGASTTALMDRLARAMVGHLVEPGDEVVVTNCDHEANIGPWRRLERHGVTVRQWSLDRESLSLRLEDLVPLLGERTRLVAFTHCSNVLGAVVPVAEIAAALRRRGILSVVDGVAWAPHRRVDVAALGVDFYGFSFYKTYGPHLACLWGRPELLACLANMNHFFVGETEVPYKLEPGAFSYEAAACLPTVVDYLEEIGAADGDLATGGDPGDSDAPGDLLERAFAAIAAHEEALAERLLAFLRDRDRVRIIGPASSDRTRRVPTVSFVVDGTASDEITRRVDEAGIGIRHGHFYAKRLIDDLGLADHGGVVRVSMVHYNTEAEVDRLLEALDRIL